MSKRKEQKTIEVSPEALKCIREFIYHLSMASFNLQKLHIETNDNEKISDKDYISFLRHKDFVENDLKNILYDEKRVYILIASVDIFFKRCIGQLAEIFDDCEILENIILNVDDEKLLNDMEGHLK